MNNEENKKCYENNNNKLSLERVKLRLRVFIAKYSIAKKIYSFLIKYKLKWFGYGVYKNVNGTEYKKNILFVYIVEPFRNLKENFHHQNYWQAKDFAKIIGAYGYNVDVINYNDRHAKLNNKYELIINMRPGLFNKYKKNVATNAKHVYYATGSDPQFLKKQENERMYNLYRRKKIKLKQMRYEKSRPIAEYKSLDAMFFIGSSYNVHTFDSYPIKKISFIKNTGYSFLKNYDFSKKSSKNFLFLAGTGLVPKGLDLLLEIFSKNKELNLYICTKLSSDKEFCKLYKKELYELDNIHPIGFINIKSFDFAELAKKCTYIIAPSCSEGQSGSVLVGMSAGLIPIVSKECGFEDDEVHHLKNCEINTIEDAVKEFSNKDMNWIKKESLKAMKIIETGHSEGNFRQSIREAMDNLLK